jgi:hypothetical protein
MKDVASISIDQDTASSIRRAYLEQIGGQNGHVVGLSASSFEPDAPATRQRAAKTIVNIRCFFMEFSP